MYNGTLSRLAAPGGGGAAPTRKLFFFEGQWWGTGGPRKADTLALWALAPLES